MKNIWTEPNKLKDKDEKETKALFEKLYNQPIYVQPELILYNQYNYGFEPVIDNANVANTPYIITIDDSTT